MDKLTRYMQNYLIYGFIPVVVLLIWSFFLQNAISDSNMLIKGLHELLSYNMMLWFLTLVVFMFSLVLIPSVREKTLIRLANLQERDEREEYITGKAARASYIATMSLTLLFLFLSLFSFHYSKIEHAEPNKPGHSVGISVGYSLFAVSSIPNQPVEGMAPIFDSNKYSLSTTTMLMILLAWQLIIFNLYARRMSK